MVSTKNALLFVEQSGEERARFLQAALTRDKVGDAVQRLDDDRVPVTKYADLLRHDLPV